MSSSPLINWEIKFLRILSHSIKYDDDDCSLMRSKASFTFEFIPSRGEYFQSMQILIKFLKVCILILLKFKSEHYLRHNVRLIDVMHTEWCTFVIWQDQRKKMAFDWSGLETARHLRQQVQLHQICDFSFLLKDFHLDLMNIWKEIIENSQNQ